MYTLEPAVNFTFSPWLHSTVFLETLSVPVSEVGGYFPNYSTMYPPRITDIVFQQFQINHSLEPVCPFADLPGKNHLQTSNNTVSCHGIIREKDSSYKWLCDVRWFFIIFSFPATFCQNQQNLVVAIPF